MNPTRRDSAPTDRRGERDRFPAPAALLLLAVAIATGTALAAGGGHPSPGAEVRVPISRLRMAETGGAFDANPCLQCHEDIGSQAGTWNGRRFSHTPHVERAGLDCSFCHTSLQQHGGITLSGVAACNECHHELSAPGSCGRCHAGAKGAPDRVFETEVGPFDHGMHAAAGFPCTGCHQGASMSTANLECTTCHAAHHRPEAGCRACHEPGSVPAHPDVVHESGCTGCHGEAAAWIDRWTREVCSVCHTDRDDHHAGTSCALCHIVPPLGG